MGRLKNLVGVCAVASLFGVGLSSSARAQFTPAAPPGSLPAVPHATLPPGTTEPANSAAMSSVAPNGLPALGTEFNPPPGPARPAGMVSTQTPPPATPSVPGQTPTQNPLLSSQPPQFQATQAAPAATNDTNFFAGNPPVQDLSSLMTGNFKDTKYKWYGFVRFDGIYDFRPMASTDSFVTSAIPVPQGRGQNSVLTPRYTRFGFDTETPIQFEDWKVRTRIEVDFFNGNTSGAFGSFPLRLRFAWAEVGPFLIGQAASLFMDYDVFPNVLDYQGPPGMVLMRQPVFALGIPLGEKVKFSIGIEQPYSDIQWLENGINGWVRSPGSGIITTPGAGRNVQDVPDLTSNVRYAGTNGHVQVAGIARKLTFQPGIGNSALDEIGYGGNLTATYHPWAALTGTPRSGECANIWSKSRFLGQFAAGRGITRYYNDENGLGLDATYDPVTGFRSIPSYGWFAAYEQWWAKNWASVFTYGQTELDLTNTLPGSTYRKAEYLSANLIWLPVERMGVGVECLYGFRQNKDGQKGENTRLQMAFQYRF